MNWENVRLIFLREVRDQLRDRRTLFTIAVLPLLLYPLLGTSFLQMAQFSREHPSKVWVVGANNLPETPRLLVNEQFAEELVSAHTGKLLKITTDEPPAAAVPEEWVPRVARAHLRDGKFDVVVFFPDRFGSELERFRTSLAEPRTGDESSAIPTDRVPEPAIFMDTASDKSRIAFDRVESVLRRWREAVVEANLRQSRIPATATEPFQVAERDVAELVQRRAALWSKILPFAALVWALTGAFYPAIDLCAGEKERGTLETLLSSPAQRSEIVGGKLLTVMTFSLANSALNLASMGLTGAFVMSQMQRLGAGSSHLNLGPPPLSALGWLLLAMVPLSALFSALSLAVAAFARSSKEGQYYLMPLLLISLPLMLVPMLPAAELDLGTSLIPVSGVMLLLRSLIEGQYFDALRFSIPVIGVTLVCCLLAIRWAIDQFNDENVLFRESERWGLGLWLRHLLRDRQDTPSAGEAIFCGMLLLIVRFFVSFLAPPPQHWSDFARLTAINLIAFIAAPALIMAVMVTRRPRVTLLLQRPPGLAVPAAILLAICLHPLGMLAAAMVQRLYPLSSDLATQLQAVNRLVAEAPHWSWILLVLAFCPAICEELAYRGFILSGLRHVGHRWAAVVISSLFFGATHGILQQSLTAFLLGLILGYVAVHSGSLFPSVAFHFIYNSLGLLLGHLSQRANSSASWLNWVLNPPEADLPYRWPVIVIGTAASLLLLAWFRSLPCQSTPEEARQQALDLECPN